MLFQQLRQMDFLPVMETEIVGDFKNPVIRQVVLVGGGLQSGDHGFRSQFDGQDIQPVRCTGPVYFRQSLPDPFQGFVKNRRKGKIAGPDSE